MPQGFSLELLVVVVPAAREEVPTNCEVVPGVPKEHVKAKNADAPSGALGRSVAMKR